MGLFGKDLRDQYVGNWDTTRKGSILLLYYDTPMICKKYPVDESGKSVISKSGKKGLLIKFYNEDISEEKFFTLNENVLSAEPDNHFIEDYELQTHFTTYYSGQVSEKLITMTMIIEGVWKNHLTGESGKAKGGTRVVLEK